MWAPLRLGDGTTLIDVNKVLVPYSIEASGQGISKRRHLGPGEAVTRPGPAPRDAVTCEFDGRTTDGDFHVTVTASVMPFPAHLFPVFTQPKPK